MRVLPLRLTQGARTAGYALFGKLPNRADFVRIDVGHPVVQEFERTLQEGLQAAAAEPGWESRYDAAQALDFHYLAHDGDWIFIGVLLPSRDLSGRRYPLVGGAVLPVEAAGGGAHLAPIAYEVFFDGLREQLRNAMENSVEALACRQFLESHVQAGDGAADVGLAQSVVARHLTNQPAARLAQLLADRQGASLAQALLNLAFYQSFLRRFEHRASDQMILLPLPQEKGEEALAACAWLALLGALWSGGRAESSWRGTYWLSRGHAPVLAATFRAMPKAYTKSIATGILGTGEAVLALGREEAAWRAHPLYAETAYALDRLLADPALTVAELAAFLEDIGRKLRREDVWLPA